MRSFILFFPPICFLSLTSTVLTGQGFEYEISAGPQVTKAMINEYQNGIVSNTPPENDRILMGYSLNLAAKLKYEKFQPGIQLKNDLVRYNVYLPVFFPSDFDAERQSRWEHIYQAYRLGLSANIRINLSSFFIQSGIAYMAEISNKTKHQFYLGSSDSFESTKGEDYTSGSGAAGELQIGLKFGKPTNRQFAIVAGCQYHFVEQEYTDELYLQHWKVTPIDFNLLLAYRFAKQE